MAGGSSRHLVTVLVALVSAFAGATLTLLYMRATNVYPYAASNPDLSTREEWPDRASALEDSAGTGGVEAFVAQQQELETKIHEILGDEVEFQDRLDPAGVKRFVIGHRYFAVRNPNSKTVPPLTPEGRRVVAQIGRLLVDKDAMKLYRRIRIEGHAMPPHPKGSDEDWRWDVSLGLAREVASVLRNTAGIPPHYFIVSGRGGQSPVDKYDLATGKENPNYNYRDPKHLRVEIVIEFAEKNALGEATRRN
ncbi:MAG: hypothetical protein KatS3mg015_1551 [Fimbriimonadales bacterium]|nr:MAG: hypothetical protein KatS3mg015_1551 [Fimbriimonadales bacterium]